MKKGLSSSKTLLRRMTILVSCLRMNAKCLTILPNAMVGCHGNRRFLLPAVRCSSSTTTRAEDETDNNKQQHLKTYQLWGATTPKNKSGVNVHTDTGHTIETDVPLKMGGKNQAPQPVETLLAAWMGCTQATALFVGRQMQPDRLILERLEFDNIQAVRDERGALQLPIAENPPVPSRLQQVSGTIRVFAAKQRELAEEELHILREQTEQRCPVANMMIASGCDMSKVEWIDGNAPTK